jgi:predicted lipoprotein with Yx(FWY)xxD motif
MQTSTQGNPSPTRRALTTAIAVGLCSLIAAAAAQPPSGAAAAGAKRVVAEAPSATLGKTVLTNLSGRTLYSLSVEKRGRFICTGSCLRLWHPLVVRAGVKPLGPVKLGVIRRPEGTRQVTYRGRPLYRFGGDSKKGQANGEGFKDVGTWHAASVGPIQPQSQPQPEPQPSPPPYPYPY